jgi:hypothetical protein
MIKSAVKSRTRKKTSPQIVLKKSLKKSPVVSTRMKNVKIEGLDNTLLSVKFKYNPLESDSKRQKSLGNAVVVYDPRGLHDFLRNLYDKNKTHKEISNTIVKDSEFVKKEFFRFLK